VYLKSRKFSLFLQAQLDFALNSLEIHKGFLRLFALNPACACETFVIFFVFRYTLTHPIQSASKSFMFAAYKLIVYTLPQSPQEYKPLPRQTL